MYVCHSNTARTLHPVMIIREYENTTAPLSLSIIPVGVTACTVGKVFIAVVGRMLWLVGDIGLSGAGHVVFGIIVGFVGAAASRNVVVGKVSFGRNTENSDWGMSVVLNNSVST